jgi:REP element-mobilizing transposase RayT
LDRPTDLLSKGYFAYTVGNSSRRAIERYLDQQAAHHGYDPRTLPPVFVEQYQLNDQDKMRIAPKHAAVVAQFHAVLATSWRKGLIGSQDGQRIAAAWLSIQDQLRIALIKVSFVPDHVHLAFRTHPTVAPIDAVVALMNSAQQVMSRTLIGAKVDRLWQPSCYIGSYGDLASSQVRKYIESWSKQVQQSA